MEPISGGHIFDCLRTAASGCVVTDFLWGGNEGSATAETCVMCRGGWTVFRRKNVCFGYWYIWVSFERSSCRRAACHPYWPSELMDGLRRYLFWVMLDSYPQEKLVNFSVSKLETNTGTKTSQCGIMLPKQRCCHSLLIFPPLYDFFFYPFNSRFFS